MSAQDCVPASADHLDVVVAENEEWRGAFTDGAIVKARPIERLVARQNVDRAFPSYAVEIFQGSRLARAVIDHRDCESIRNVGGRP